MRIRKILCVLLIACAIPAITLAETYQVSQKLHPDMPSFRFWLDYTFSDAATYQNSEGDEFPVETFYYISRITVSDESSGAVRQQILLNPASETYDNETLGLVLEDMNFDGYIDMRVMQFVSAGVNIPYYCWLWDPATQSFVYHEQLSAISAPYFDAARQEVRGFESNGELDFTDTTYLAGNSASEEGMSGTRVETSRVSEYLDTTYIYGETGLVMIARTTTSYDYGSGIMTSTTEQLMDGVMTIVGIERESFLQIDEGEFTE